MNDFGFNYYNALFQRMYGPKPEKDKAGWLDPALTAAGAIAGTMLMPGAGTAAGASLGRAAGGAAHSAANGDASGAIQGAMGLPAFWQQFAPYIGTFAEGGPVPEIEQTDEYGNPIAPQGQAQPQQALSMLTPELIAQLRQHAQTLAGQAPGRPTVANGGLAQTRTASHPTLEALATLMPTILGSLPKPANPKNTKAIGAWAPFAGNAIAAPALIAQSRRKAANAPIEDANAQAQSDYEARQKAYEDQKKAYGTALIQGAMRPQGQSKETPYDQRPMTEQEAMQVTGSKRWAGSSRYEYKLWLDSQNGTGSGGTTKMEGDDLPGGAETLTDDALRQQAIYFAATGKLMETGGRDRITAQQSRRIMNEAARLFPGRSLALARAAYAGNTKSRTEIQMGRDGIEAFAASAAKNLSLMKGVLNKLPESGSPVLNWGWRKFEDKFAGNPDVSAFQTLRLSLNAEYARLTQSMKLTGTGIPVSAQNEIRDAISPNATVGQILHAYRILYLESANRAQAMNDMIREIDSRFNLVPETPVAPTRVGKIEDSEYTGRNPRGR